MLIITSIIALIIAITVHEFAHALIADRLGDPTPRSYGRLTLNPLAHADPFGTILLPLIGALTGLPTIGWAKPVPIDPYNFANPRRDELLVSLAGPMANMLLAIISSLIIRFNLAGPISPIFYVFLIINVTICLFNLLPLPPLDGSKILFNLLPRQTSLEWQSALNRYSLPLFLILILLPIGNQNLLSLILNPATSFVIKLLLY